jgi:hypothetical protein
MTTVGLISMIRKGFDPDKAPVIQCKLTKTEFSKFLEDIYRPYKPNLMMLRTEFGWFTFRVYDNKVVMLDGDREIECELREVSQRTGEIQIHLKEPL